LHAIKKVLEEQRNGVFEAAPRFPIQMSANFFYCRAQSAELMLRFGVRAAGDIGERACGGGGLPSAVVPPSHFRSLTRSLSGRSQIHTLNIHDDRDYCAFPK
jgi:hypothetical protein